MPFKSWSSAGIAAIQMGIVDVNGYPMGITGSLSNGSGAALKLLKMSKRLGGQIPNPVRATAIGDNNRNRHEYIFNPPNMAELGFMFHSMDLDAYAGTTGLKIVTDGNGDAVAVETNAAVNAFQANIVVNIDSQISDSANFGLKRYINEIFPLVTMVPLWANHQEVAPADWTWQGIPTQAGHLPWGIPFSVNTHGATRAGRYVIGSDYPIVEETFVAGSGSTTYTLTYTPATPTATYALAWTNNPAAGTPLTIAVSGKTATFAAATAGDIIVFRYEATDLLISI